MGGRDRAPDGVSDYEVSHLHGEVQVAVALSIGKTTPDHQEVVRAGTVVLQLEPNSADAVGEKDRAVVHASIPESALRAVGMVDCVNLRPRERGCVGQQDSGFAQKPIDLVCDRAESFLAGDELLRVPEGFRVIGRRAAAVQLVTVAARACRDYTRAGRGLRVERCDRGLDLCVRAAQLLGLLDRLRLGDLPGLQIVDDVLDRPGDGRLRRAGARRRRGRLVAAGGFRAVVTDVVIDQLPCEEGDED